MYFLLQLKDSWGNSARPYTISNVAILLTSSSFSQTITGVADNIGDILSSSSSLGMASTPDESMPGGLTATYYSDFNALAPVTVSCQANGSWRNVQYCGGVDLSTTLFVESSKLFTRLNQIKIGSAQSWSVRYKGMLLTSQSGNYTFSFVKPSCEQCILTFSINGSSISFNNNNNWQSAISATINVSRANTLHDISIWYQQTHYLEPLQLRMTFSYNSQMAQDVPTSNLFPLAGRFIVKATPFLTSELRAEVFTMSRVPALTATFYSESDFRGPFRVQDYAGSYLECGLDCMPLDPVSIRWSGFYKESAFSTLSVSFSGSFCQYSLRIWLDNMLYADLNQPMDDGGSAARYINFRSRDPGMAHDLRIEYSKLRGNMALNPKP